MSIFRHIAYIIILYFIIAIPLIGLLTTSKRYKKNNSAKDQKLIERNLRWTAFLLAIAIGILI